MQNLQSCSRKTGVCLQILGMFSALQALEILHSWLGNAQVATPKNVVSHVFCVSYLPEGFNSSDRFITVSRSQVARPPKLWSAVPLFPDTRIGTHFSRKRWHLDDCCFRKTSCESDPFKDDAAQRVSVCFSPPAPSMCLACLTVAGNVVPGSIATNKTSNKASLGAWMSSHKVPSMEAT